MIEFKTKKWYAINGKDIESDRLIRLEILYIGELIFIGSFYLIKRGNNMIRIDKLSYSFPQKDLYSEISFTLEAGQHCAFIGASGNGKTTLIDIIMDPENYMFDGELEIDPSCRIGYVRQFSQLDETKETTVFEYIAEKFIVLQDKLTSICTQMETSSDIDALLEDYQNTLDAFDAIGGDDFESKIMKKLALAGLEKHRDMMVSELSGGEFKLVQVIREMLNTPDLLVMDEPDVFLDFANLNALKALINSHKQTILVITHNRYLLNHCFNKILHLENMKLNEFDGRYIDYNFELLQRKIELQELAVADEEEIARNELLIKRLRKIASNDSDASRGKSLKARVKIQERLEARKTEMPFVEIKQPDISLNTENEIEETVAIRVSGYKAAFDEVLVEDGEFEIKSNEKVAIIGQNGTGKTTLLRDIFKNSHESVSIDENIEMAYLSQSQDDILNESNTIYDEFFDAGFESYRAIMTYLYDYGFEDEILEQKISSLSGGEKNLLQLAKISSGKANMLLLDEPTSHLDTYSQIALENAMEGYNGGILMISHDYYSIANCMDYVLIIEDKKIRRMSMRKFRKMIYSGHFNKDYLEIEQKKKSVETEIELALKDTDFERAKVLCDDLEEIIKML